jgi:hypothetical protein
VFPIKRVALLGAPLAAALLVACAAPAAADAATVLGRDAFTRQVTGGWGQADTGGSWSMVQGPASAMTVDGSQGKLLTPSGYSNLRMAQLPGVQGRDVDVTAKLSFSDIKGTGAYGYSALQLRRQADGSHFRIGLWAFSSGKLLMHSQTSAGADIAPDADTGIAFTAGAYMMRVQLQGASPTTVRTKAWKAGTAEPSAWLSESKTTIGPQLSGGVGVRTSALSTPAAVAFGFDDLVVSDMPVRTSDMSRWRLVDSDDFSGSTLNTAMWSAYNSPGHGGNGLRRPAQIKVANGELVITAEMINGVLNSGGMSHRSAYTYGRYEFRARTEADPSGATSGVVLTWPAAGGWPATGELDMYETGTEPNRAPFHSFVHYGATNEQYFFTHALDGTEWHDMAMEWEPTALRFYRDDELVWTVTDPAAIPTVAHRMVVQLDAFQPTMGAPVKMYVDDVRVYQPATVPVTP